MPVVLSAVPAVLALLLLCLPACLLLLLLFLLWLFLLWLFLVVVVVTVVVTVVPAASPHPTDNATTQHAFVADFQRKGFVYLFV